MQKRFFVPLVLVLLLLAACGGSGEPSPTLTPTGGGGVSIPATEPPSEEPAEQSSDPTVAPVNEEPTAESAPSEEATATPEGEAETTGERQMSGTDPDTGLEINPEQVVAGIEFIVRGEIVSMTLTPQDAPEFVILSPTGKRYRFRPQALSEIFFEDGSQLAVHQYQLGLMASATLYLDPAGGTTAVASSTNMILYASE